jgi:NTE family protein
MADFPNINAQNVNYLTFEGGGGKGIVYVGVVKALEEIYALSDRLDLPTPATGPGSINLPPAEVAGARRLIYPTLALEKRQIKGISGASAGAITAFSLALGMSSKDLEYEAARLDLMSIGYMGFKQPVNVYENFFEDPSHEYCAVDPQSKTNSFDTHAALENLLIGLMYTPIGSGVSLPLQLSKPKNVWTRRVIKTEFSNAIPVRFFQYMHSLLFNRGIFSGVAARAYFTYLLDEYLLKKRRTYPKELLPLSIRNIIAKPANQITFYELFDLTGVDLLIVGTNLSAHSGTYFSVGHTPDFPVVDEVTLSMSMPFLFKPVLVNTLVDADHGADDYTTSYNGLYVDGGMAQNFPLHAFDHLRPFQHRGGTTSPMVRELLFNGEPVNASYEVAAPRMIFDKPPEFCDCVAGFNLGLVGRY